MERRHCRAERRETEAQNGFHQIASQAECATEPRFGVSGNEMEPKMTMLSKEAWKKLTILLIASFLLMTATAFAWPYISYRMLTGRLVPIHKIESLQNPVAVRGWISDGLILSDGRRIQLPGFVGLPPESTALAEATKRGIELGKDGSVVGLIKIHHWCGNDPVREHIARVNISDLMMFLNLGQTVAPIPESEFTTHENAEKFSEYGWNVSEFYRFQMWRQCKELDKESGA